MSELSFDHDPENDERGTGFDVLLWIEEAVYTNHFSPPEMRVYSANSSAKIKIESAIENIKN